MIIISQLFNIHVRATLDPTSTSGIQGQIDTLSKNLKPVSLKVEVDNKEALRTIETFNQRMSQLQETASKTGGDFGKELSPQIQKYQQEIDGLTKKVEELQKANTQASNASRQTGQEGQRSTRQQNEEIEKLTQGWGEATKEIRNYGKQRQTTTRAFQQEGLEFDRTTSVTYDGSGNVISRRETDDYVKAQRRANQELKQIEVERARITKELDRIERTGYGREKSITAFRDRSEATQDIKTLESLNTEVKDYGRTIDNVGKKDGLQRTINSLKTLQRNGTIKPAKGSTLDKLGDDLVNANTTKEINDVNSAVQRFQKTLSTRDKGFMEIEKIRADDILPSQEISKVRDRLRKAESPEQARKIYDTEIKGAEGLVQRNNAQKEALRLNDQRVTKQHALQQQLERLNNQNRVTEASFNRLNRAIRELPTKRLDALRRVMDRQNTRAQGRESQTNIENQIIRAQRQFELNRQRLETGLVGSLSPEHSKRLNEISQGFGNLSRNTRNLPMEINRLQTSFGQLNTEVRKADEGMARFTGQTVAAMLRIPIYAAGVAAMYAPIRAIRDAFTQIVELDSQMTVLERVSNGVIQANDALEDSIGIADRLGNTIAEVNEGLVNFARQGYRGGDLTAITEVATMMGNVSELNVDESASALTAAMKAFNIEAEDSVRIVDSLNEVNIKSASGYSNVA